MQKLFIRKIILSDAKAVRDIGISELGYECDLSVTQEKIKNLNPEREAVFVAELEGNIAGFIHVERYDVLFFETMANILGLAVKKEFHKQGIGKALLLSAEQWARENKISFMRLNSGINRTDAHRFYNHLGYTAEKDQKRFIKKLR